MPIPSEQNHNSAAEAQAETKQWTRAAPLSLLRSAVLGNFRVLYVDDVRELLRHAKSKWWIRNCFAPESRLKIGRSVAWRESDALDWIASRRAPR